MILQPQGSKLCGQCCLAMILGISLQDAIALIGHSNGTRTRELLPHLKVQGRKKGPPASPALCICRPRHYKNIGNWHWVYYKEGTVFDPAHGRMSLDTFLQYHQISSHLVLQ